MVRFTAISAAVLGYAAFAAATSPGINLASSIIQERGVSAIQERGVSLVAADIMGDIDLINPGIDIDLDAGVGILAPSTCGARGSLLSVGVGLDINIPPLLHIDICLCVNVLQLVPESHFQPCPPCSHLKEPICGSGQCGCQCLAHAHPGGDGCICDPGFHEVDGECVVGPSQRARKSKRIAAQ